MASVNINVRVDEEVKREAEFLFDKLGLNMTTAMNMFLRACLRYDGIPFELRLHKPNAETLAAMEDVKNDRNLLGPFNSVDEMMETLLADD